MAWLWGDLGWAVLGGVIGVALAPFVRSLLVSETRSRVLISATALGVATAIVFGLLAWRIGPRAELLVDSCLAALCVPLAAIDLSEHRLPNKLLLPAYPVLLGLLGLAASYDRDATPILMALAGMSSLLVFYLAIALISGGGLGAGDVRLAGVLGLALGWRGWQTLIVGALLGLVYAGLAGLIMILLRRATCHTCVPLGPALIGGAFTALLILNP